MTGISTLMRLQLCQPSQQIGSDDQVKARLNSKTSDSKSGGQLGYCMNLLTNPLPTLSILCHIPSHKLTHLLVGIKTPFASALVGCHRSCYSFRGSEVACSVCLPVSILHFGNPEKRFVPILPASMRFSSLTLQNPCLHCSRS